MNPIDISPYSDAFKKLVLDYQSKGRFLTDVPKEFIQFFGYPCLANSLLFKEPQIPNYDSKTITAYLKNTDFPDFKSFLDYIKSLKEDVDKLYAIFAWTALNLEYDVDSLVGGTNQEISLEDLFNYRVTNGEGYSMFFIEVAKQVGINSKKIQIHPYPNIAKAYQYDPLHPPMEVKPDHCAVFISINGVPFVSEPTWAAGHLNALHEFQSSFNPEWFLVPLQKTLCDHFPCEDSSKFLPFQISFKDFLQSCRVSPSGIQLKTESNPFSNILCETGNLKQIYSCRAPIQWIQIYLYLQQTKGTFERIESDGITSYEIVQYSLPNHEDRCRFVTNIAFPQIGFYKVELYVNSYLELTYFVDCKSESHESVPVRCNQFHEQKFIPISPQYTRSQVRHGVALIRFAVSSQRSSLMWNIYKLPPNSLSIHDGTEIDRKYGKSSQLLLDFNASRHEDHLCVTFPSDGTYAVLIFFENDIGSYSSYITYYFDVTGVSSEDPEPISPTKFMFKGRKFMKNPLETSIQVTPPFGKIYSTDAQQTVTVDKLDTKGNLVLDLVDLATSTKIPVQLVKKKKTASIFTFTIPDGTQKCQLTGSIDDNPVFVQNYTYYSGLRDPTENELNLLDELRRKIELDTTSMTPEQIKNANAGSKTCLLI